MTADLDQLKRDLCEIGRRVWQRGFVASNDGNFSARLGDGTFLATPTGVSKGFMQPGGLCILDAGGRKVGGGGEPTSEVRMHLFIYRHRADVQAVVHAHPPHATAFCVARRALPKCVLPEIEVYVGEIPMASYETPGSWKFAETLAPFVADHNAFLLASHGAVAVGRDPFEAYHRLESLEHYCHILLLAGQLGGWERLEPEKVGELLQIRSKLGYAEPRLARPPEQWCDGAESPPASSREDLRRLVERLVREMLRE